MKKYFILFILFCTVGVCFILQLSTAKEEFTPYNKGKYKPSDFVSIKNNKFNLNEKEFYPIAINYIAQLQTDGKEMWVRPTLEYGVDITKDDFSKQITFGKLKTDFKLIHKMGFNTVRIVGVGEEQTNDAVEFSPVSVRPYVGNNNYTTFALEDSASYQHYFNALEELLTAANDAGLKVILLVRVRPEVKTTFEYLLKLAAYFKYDATLLAFDLFNEPLYFDKNSSRTKEQVYSYTKRCYSDFKKIDPNHLITIGLVGVREVFTWDPNLVNVDFISFHPYNAEPQQVMNELYWYNQFVTKPWMLGETGIPADNDSISYEEQRQFAKQSLKQTYNCGAIGYSWWQYKDVEWYSYHANYLGVVDNKGETKVENSTVKGTPKPMVEEFKNFDDTMKKENCICMNNYYNLSQHKSFRLKGYLLDGNDNPVKGGVIMAWNQWWSHSYITPTKVDGSFELLSDFPFYHWMASATFYSMTRGEVLLDSVKTNSDKIPTVDLGNVNVDKLSF